MKLSLRAPSSERPRLAAPRLDDFAGLDRLDRDELDEDFAPPSERESQKRVA